MAGHVAETLGEWRPTILRNLERLRESTQRQPHLRNLDRWQHLIDDRDLTGLHRVMTGLDTDSVEMREVSPMRGLLSQRERSEVLGLMRRDQTLSTSASETYAPLASLSPGDVERSYQ